jgi:hypothetical protein
MRSHKPGQLLARVRKFPAVLPISGKMELSSRHDSHRDHWIKWLEECDGPGYYNRKNPNRDAAFIYSHVQSASMVVYLGEAAGVETARVKAAFHVATTSAFRNRAALTAATRRALPWSLVAKALWP